MKILVMTGSPHKNGTSALLADKFIEGAKEAGHEIYRFDAGLKNIHPCTACYTCQTTDKGCIFKDDEQEVYSQILTADAVVFIAPIYYYGMCAQLKVAIDRFFALGDALKADKKCALLLTCEDETTESVEGAIATVKGMCNYLGWKLAGVVSALSCIDRAAMDKTDYPQKAYELGKSF
jgi:multimeric flavodoxin WrbA